MAAREACLGFISTSGAFGVLLRDELGLDPSLGPSGVLVLLLAVVGLIGFSVVSYLSAPAAARRRRTAAVTLRIATVLSPRAEALSRSAGALVTILICVALLGPQALVATVIALPLVIYFERQIVRMRARNIARLLGEPLPGREDDDAKGRADVVLPTRDVLR